MAAFASPSGFSYAQAAKGAAHQTSSQASSSKVTSGAATPSTGALTDLTPGGNWADDVEDSVGDKTNGTQKKETEDSKVSPPKDSAVERTKVEDKTQGGPSGTSSPDLTGSVSSITKEDDASSTPNEPSSENTSDTKSQASEPAWIVERKERQNGHHSNEKPAKGEKKNKDAPEPLPEKPIVFQPAAPPSVNIWTQRAESQKAKMAATPQRPVVSASSAIKENLPPQNGGRVKTNSTSSIQRETVPTTGDESSRLGSSKPTTNENRSDSSITGSTKAVNGDRETAKAHLTSPPSVRDEMQWPTPDSVPEKERKSIHEKDSETQRTEDSTPTIKSKKPQWQTLPVTPKYVEPADLRGPKPRGPPNGDRSGRNLNGPKGRGPNRGTSNPVAGNDREPRSNSTPNNTDAAAQEVSSVAGGNNSTAKPPRAASTSPRGQHKKEMLPERGFKPRATPPDGLIQDGARPSEARRNKSPKKSPPGKKNEDASIPQPLPRRGSIAAQTEGVTENGENGARKSPTFRPSFPDGRKETRNGDSPRDGFPSMRGANKRSGRGRGGNAGRDIPNGHQGGSPYVNNYGTDFYSPYAVAQSPGYPGARGGHYGYHGPRPAWRSNPRSQSIPMEAYAQNTRGAFSPPQPMHGIQTFVPGMFDMNSYTMSAVPYNPQMETESFMSMIRSQVEYYFSTDNLIKDTFLRKHMDSQGFVFFDLVLNFNRIKQMNADRELVKAICINSSVIEMCIGGEDGRERLRKRDGWEQFRLPMDSRDPTVQNDGPQELKRPERPRLNMDGVPSHFQGPASAIAPTMPPRFDRRSYDSGYTAANAGYPLHQFGQYVGYPEEMYAEAMNGDEPRGRTARSPHHENVMSPMEPTMTGTDNSNFETDAFPDEQVNVLTVVVKSLDEQQKTPYHSAASRTFSNGSIDSRTIMNEMNSSIESRSHASPNGEQTVNGGDRLSLTRTLSPRQTNPKEGAEESRVFWVKDQDCPIHNLPSDLTPEPYLRLRERSLAHRERAATGSTPEDLDILYKFWCHFLLRNFNNHMYSEFKHFAHADAKDRYSFTGLQQLVLFYKESLLKNSLRDRIAKDYVELVKNEPSELEGQAFKTLRAAWRDGALNLKNRKKLSDILDEELKVQLDKVDK